MKYMNAPCDARPGTMAQRQWVREALDDMIDVLQQNRKGFE